MSKIVMKNKKTGQYWIALYPPFTDDIWKAQRFDSVDKATDTVKALIPDKYFIDDFVPVKITLIEEEL